jgi:hypothetical protein
MKDVLFDAGLPYWKVTALSSSQTGVKVCGGVVFVPKLSLLWRLPSLH